MNQPRKPGNALLCGIVLTVVGAVLQLPAQLLGGSGVKDFLAGLLLGGSSLGGALYANRPLAADLQGNADLCYNEPLQMNGRRGPILRMDGA